MAGADAAWFDRVDHGGELPRAPGIAQGGERHRRPDRPVRVLAAVLPHARHVAADVAGVQIRLVEGRIEQLDERVLAPHEPLVDRLHGRARAPRVARAGEHRPALRDRIDPAFGAARRAERRAVVEVGAAVPLAVPAVLLEALAQPGALALAARGEGGVAARTRERAELPQHFAQEEAQPDALALAAHPHQIHAVVPVAGAHQRQAVRAEAQAVRDRAHAVLVEAGRRGGASGQVVVGIVLRADRAAFEKVHGLVQHPGVAAARHVAAHRQRQPEVVVGAMRAHAAAGWRMPPVLDVALLELAARAQQQVLAQPRRARRGPAPSRPAAGRGSRRRRPTGSSRCAPRRGTPGSGTPASRWPER